MRIWNLTPHTIEYDDGVIQRSLLSDGRLRLVETTNAADPVAGMATVHIQYSQVEGIPPGIVAGDVLLVSTLVGDKWMPADRPTGVTVLVPDTGATCRRDENGRIISVRRLIRK